MPEYCGRYKDAMSQSTSHILMIRPANFGFNEETAGSNVFQNREASDRDVNARAQLEFDRMVQILRSNGIDVTVVDDTPVPRTPDAIFPNNWVSFHADGRVFLYPMQAENRRLERRMESIGMIRKHFKINEISDLSYFEDDCRFLEGTGSMVLDRDNKIAYACLSPRTAAAVLAEFCRLSGYSSVSFDAADEKGTAIYHTNVLMCVGTGFAVVCMESITDPQQRSGVRDKLTAAGKEVVDISFAQMNRFAGNMLEVKNERGDTLIVMSKSAFDSLLPAQRAVLERYGKLIYADISTIETIGGGSARCMMAEVHLPELP